MIDLHMHTNLSDGSDSPLKLLKKVEAAGVKVFSVTDHDDLAANAVILAAMKQKRYTAKFVTGCEISSVFEGKNLHLLCYGFDLDAESMISMIAEGASLRRQRITAMFDHLRTKHGITISHEDRARILRRKIPGKVHITDAAMKQGINMTRNEFFKTCLDDMESREFKISAEKVIDTVDSAGGAVSFAHPIEVQREYNISEAEIAGIASKLKAKGLVGIEVYHCLHGKVQVEQYRKIAHSCGLLISGGSDYHGKNKDVKIGQSTDYGYIPTQEEIIILKSRCLKLA